jgi:hypothetical protein
VLRIVPSDSDFSTLVWAASAPYNPLKKHCYLRSHKSLHGNATGSGECLDNQWILSTHRRFSFWGWPLAAS